MAEGGDSLGCPLVGRSREIDGVALLLPLFPADLALCLSHIPGLSAEAPMVAMSLPGCAAWLKELLIHQEFPSAWAAGIVMLCSLFPLFSQNKVLADP